MNSVFAFAVAQPIETDETTAPVEGRYDTETQTMVWAGEADAVLAGSYCTGYPAGLYLSCVNHPGIPPWCNAYNPNPGASWGYRCDAY